MYTYTRMCKFRSIYCVKHVHICCYVGGIAFRVDHGRFVPSPMDPIIGWPIDSCDRDSCEIISVQWGWFADDEEAAVHPRSSVGLMSGRGQCVRGSRDPPPGCCWSAVQKARRRSKDASIYHTERVQKARPVAAGRAVELKIKIIRYERVRCEGIKRINDLV